jgi:hypothetical protein
MSDTKPLFANLPASLIQRLDQAAASRKESRQFPWTKTDIVAAALEAWLKRNQPKPKPKPKP